MDSSQNPENKPPSPPTGYPSETRSIKKKLFPTTKKKGERGFIEGCLFALCCCWLCEACC